MIKTLKTCLILLEIHYTYIASKSSQVNEVNLDTVKLQALAIEKENIKAEMFQESYTEYRLMER